eukprot:CAMPEP_0114238668 /NCGR_PEP_ID=MMETSP0058-20121206/8043_1 /TAXON_ID=36894 /ORGANISM="Pyramimonas parkeae, CCMP726" /LENGTH=190 /DNA_ID=CAMNT_0001350785 /DNA_START=99 /DNA_END=672 /DNA_ORIENTATION=-
MMTLRLQGCTNTARAHGAIMHVDSSSRHGLGFNSLCARTPLTASLFAPRKTRPIPQLRCPAPKAVRRTANMAFVELELTEENIEAVLLEARSELLQLFDESVGITGTVTLADLDGPVVVLSLQGRFWHERSMVLARVGHFLKQRIPEIMDVEIENEAQLDDSPENFDLLKHGIAKIYKRKDETIVPSMLL